MYEYYLVSLDGLYTVKGTTGRWRLWLNSDSKWQLDIECKCLKKDCGRLNYVNVWMHESKLKIFRKWAPEYKVFGCTKT